MKPTSILLTVLASSLILLGCKQDDPPKFHYEYLGMEEGRYVIYDVQQITHDIDLVQHDTLRYQLKTVWGDVYVDNEGRSGREFFRYTRATSSDPWLISDLWHGVYDGIRGEIIEENERVVKLVFAPTYQKTWDANAYNQQDPLDCYYRDIHADTTINGVMLDSTLVVEQQADANLIDTVRRYEMYAKHIGMIYKHEMDNHYQFGSPEVNKGTEFYMTYVSHGYE